MNRTLLLIAAACSLAAGSAFAQRDPLKWPFAKTSIWNVPIHNQAVYAPAGIQDAANFAVDEDVIILKPTVPAIKVETNYAGWSSSKDRCPAEGPTLFSAPIPKDWIYDKTVWDGTTPNSGAAILLPDNRIIQTQPFAKCGTDYATSQFVWSSDNCQLTGECITGAHGGSGLSAIGGAIRVGEFTAGQIRHVIKLNLFGKENFYRDASGGFRWPATKADGGFDDPAAYNYYGGTNPQMKIGALLALHKDLNLTSLANNSLGLETEAGLILARALQNYGGYTVDNTAWDSYAFITENGPDGSVRDEFKRLYGFDINVYGGLDKSPWARDIKKLFANLQVITNNTQGNPGGGPVSDLTNRRAPAAPDFLPTRTFKIMPVGDSKTEGGGGGNQQSSWRGFLRTKLLQAGYQIDYVGDRRNFAEGDTEPYDQDHAGHGGYTIGPDINRFCPTCETTGIFEHIQDWLPAANPDIVLLAIGVNDMFGANLHAPNYAATAPDRYQALVDKILQLKPGVRLILGTIEPVKWDKNWGSNPNDNNLGALNARIRAIANASATDNIFLAEVYQNMLSTWDPADFFDDLHLSKQGATKDAAIWFDALVPVLNNTPNNVAPTVNLTSPGRGTTFAAPATISLEATANDSDGNVTKVEFYNAGTKLGEAVSAPFAYTWSDVDEGTYLLKAIAIDNLFGSTASPVDTLTVTSTDGYVKFTGTGIGSPGSYQNNGKTFASALDGEVATYFDGATANGQWVGLDLGTAKIVRKVRVIPRTGWALRLNGGKIQGSNTPDFSSAVDLYTFTQSPIDGFYTTARLTTTGLYRYYRFLSPNNGYGNIAEVEFWGAANDPVSQVPVVTLDSTLNNSRFRPGATIRLNAIASDPDGTISKVEFFAGTTLLGTATAAPYTFTWTDAPLGNYLISARATDNAGVSATSATARVSVDTSSLNVLYAENFDANSAPGWVVNSGTWVAANQRYESTNTNGEFTAYYNGASFTNYTYTLDAVANWDNNIGFLFNYQTTSNYYMLVINTKSKTAELKKRVNGTQTTIATAPFTGGGTGTKHTIAITNNGSTSTVKINGVTVFDKVSTTEFPGGKIGLYSFYCPSRFDNIVVTSTNALPTVSLTTPANEATFTAPAAVTLTANASDTDGSIAKVDFYNGGALLGTVTSSPYTYVWNNVVAGTYALSARATDNGGQTVTSSSVQITVRQNAVQESVAFSNPPLVVNPGQSYTVNVTYAAGRARIIDVYLFDAAWKTIASKNVRVNAGSGTQTVQLTVPATAAPTQGGHWSVNLWADDWSAISKSATVGGVRVNAAPTVSVTSPDEGAAFTAPAELALTATASDADGRISRVEFYEGTNRIGTASTAPFSITWPSPAPGVYSVIARAFDNDSLVSASAVRTVTVNALPPANVRVLYRNADGNPANNVIKPTLQLVNDGTNAVSYEGLTLRYWLTAEQFAPVTNLSVYWAQVGTSNVQLRYVPLEKPRQGAWGYVEYRFSAGAGQLAPGANSGEIQSGIAKQTQTDFNETDDFSYASSSTFVANEHVTVYLAGPDGTSRLIWGTEPAEVPTQLSLKAYTKTVGSGANTISTYLQLHNEGNVQVSYPNLTVRYYLTGEARPDQLRLYMDYAQLGGQYITGRFVGVEPARPGADAYLEFSFGSELDVLSPASSTGDIQYRIAKADWTDFIQSNDYSLVSSSTFTENPKVVIYQGGTRIWGEEPAASGRVASSSEIPLQVKVLGNPVRGSQVAVEVIGAKGQRLSLELTDTQGRVLTQQQVGEARDREELRLDTGRPAGGRLLLRVRTPLQSQTVQLLQLD